MGNLDFSKRLTELRGDRTQTAFASEIGISQKNISKYESGRLPDTAQMFLLAERLGVSADWLYSGKGSMTSNLSEEQKDLIIQELRKENKELRKFKDKVFDLLITSKTEKSGKEAQILELLKAE